MQPVFLSRGPKTSLSPYCFLIFSMGCSLIVLLVGVGMPFAAFVMSLVMCSHVEMGMPSFRRLVRTREFAYSGFVFLCFCFLG